MIGQYNWKVKRSRTGWWKKTGQTELKLTGSWLSVCRHWKAAEMCVRVCVCVCVYMPELKEGFPNIILINPRKWNKEESCGLPGCEGRSKQQNWGNS